MGLFADFLVATPEEALRYPADYEARGTFERQHIEGPTCLALGLLWADLLDDAWSASTHRLDAVAETGPHDGGIWQLKGFPAAFLEAVDTVPAARLDVALARWLARDDMAGWTPAAGREFFGELQALERSARAQGKGLYLYFED